MPCSICCNPKMKYLEAFIYIIIMLGHLNLLKPMEHYQVIDMFAGRGRLAKLAKALGLQAAAVDSEYDSKGDNKRRSNCMDINTSGGFLLLLFKRHVVELTTSVLRGTGHSS